MSTSSHRTEHLVGGYLLILGGIAFIWFCVGLRQRMELAGPAEVGSGRLVSALSVLGASAMTAAAMVAAALIGVVTVATVRSNAFPRWVAYTGWVAVLGAIASVIFVPIVLPLLWFLAVAIIGLARTASPELSATV